MLLTLRSPEPRRLDDAVVRVRVFFNFKLMLAILESFNYWRRAGIVVFHPIHRVFSMQGLFNAVG